ncbi:MAG: RdgB/HAM1 family non-canonical purine NTP pyrophosphatase, partial [Nitriliruptoraceae bacterium]
MSDAARVVAGPRIVVATGNMHKLEEIRAILAGLDVTLLSMQDFAIPEPIEDGDTFEANAYIKARACVAATRMPAIADDSGIEVDALGGAPGVYSARYAGHPTDDRANNAKLIAQLSGHRQPWTARFVCAAALVLPDGTEHVVREAMEGRVVAEPRGAHGFGYDPHFVSSAADGRTNAELLPHQKDAISHRGAAFRALRQLIEAQLLSETPTPRP